MEDNCSPILLSFCLILLVLSLRLLTLGGHPYGYRVMAGVLVALNVLLLAALGRATTLPNARKRVVVLGALSSVLGIGASLWSAA
jgi:uncharacterized BrkB/YihY/UPF0761 family membrane protein